MSKKEPAATKQASGDGLKADGTIAQNKGWERRLGEVLQGGRTAEVVAGSKQIDDQPAEQAATSTAGDGGAAAGHKTNRDIDKLQPAPSGENPTSGSGPGAESAEDSGFSDAPAQATSPRSPIMHFTEPPPFL